MDLCVLKKLNRFIHFCSVLFCSSQLERNFGAKNTKIDEKFQIRRRNQSAEKAAPDLCFPSDRVDDTVWMQDSLYQLRKKDLKAIISKLLRL